MRLFFAHTMTVSQGGSLLGVYLTRRAAKAALIRHAGLTDGVTDWGHFIRVGDTGKAYGSIWNMPKSEGK